MNRLKTLVIIIFCSFFTTCGIEELYYLPQVPESAIDRKFNTSAEIRIPVNLLNSVDYSYATGYAIFYRIYFSNIDDDNINENIKSNNYDYPGLSADYSYLYPYTNPVDTTSIMSSNTFSSRRYYELELENKDISIFLKSGGTFDIQFPIIYRGDKPSIEYNNDGIKINLLRSDDRGAFNPKPDKYFLNSDDLKKTEYANSTYNADVWLNNNSQNDVAYVSMYIVAVGVHPTNFSRLFGSKPTHIGIFKLTPSS